MMSGLVLVRIINRGSAACRSKEPKIVIASEAKQSIAMQSKSGLLRRFAPRNDAEA
jgi:hypothetical protein